MTAIFVRELRSAFSGMLGWLLAAFLTAASGLYFTANNLGLGLTDFGYYTLYQTSFVLLVYLPVLAMRSLAGERQARTDQLLLSSPVSVWGIVAGKYFALCAVFALHVFTSNEYFLLDEHIAGCFESIRRTRQKIQAKY